MAAKKKVAWSEAELRTLYEERGLSERQIGEVKGVHRATVNHFMKKFGIARRPPGSGLVPKGKDHHSYKHGLNAKGYRVESVRGQPKYLHRQSAESVLGRPLSKNEVVHHCNEDKADNRPENLWVFPSQSAHQKYHTVGVVHPDTIFLKDCE